MLDRRDFLKGVVVGSGLVALNACYLAKFRLRPDNKEYKIEKKLRDEVLELNTSRSLRRYSSLPNDPLTRESQLVELARTEIVEDAFAYVLPENVWYEIGCRETGHEVTNLTNILMGLSDSNKIKKIKQMYNYHYHPIWATAKQALKTSWFKPEQGETLVDLAYLVCLQPSPPAFDDLDNERKMQRDFKTTDLVSRVADCHGVWEYKYNEQFLKKMKSNVTAKYHIHYVTQLLDMSQIYVKSQRKHFTGKKFIKFFQNSLIKSGYKGDEIQLSFREVKPFHPSKEEFKHNLRKWDLIK